MYEIFKQILSFNYSRTPLMRKLVIRISLAIPVNISSLQLYYIFYGLNVSPVVKYI